MTEIELDELAERVPGPGLVLLDVRSLGEYDGTAGNWCDPRQGHIPGARHLDVVDLANVTTLDEVRSLVGEPEGAEVVAYCHSGNRSAYAAEILRAAGYEARNYGGSWHEWARTDLPIEA